MHPRVCGYILQAFFVLVGVAGITIISYSSISSPASNYTTNGDSQPYLNTTTITYSNSSIDDVSASLSEEFPLFLNTTFDSSYIYVGVLCGLASALCTTLHLLVFKKTFPNVDLYQISLIISLTSGLICAVYLPVIVTLNLTSIETWDLARMPWGPMFLDWSCAPGRFHSIASFGCVSSIL